MPQESTGTPKQESIELREVRKLWAEDDRTKPGESNGWLAGRWNTPLLPSTLNPWRLHPKELAQVLRHEAGRLETRLRASGDLERCGVGCRFAGKPARLACFAWAWIARLDSGVTYDRSDRAAEPWHRLESFTRCAIRLLPGTVGAIPGTSLSAIRWPWAMRTVAIWLDSQSEPRRRPLVVAVPPPTTGPEILASIQCRLSLTADAPRHYQFVPAGMTPERYLAILRHSIESDGRAPTDNLYRLSRTTFTVPGDWWSWLPRPAQQPRMIESQGPSVVCPCYVWPLANEADVLHFLADVEGAIDHLAGKVPGALLDEIGGSAPGKNAPQVDVGAKTEPVNGPTPTPSRKPLVEPSLNAFAAYRAHRLLGKTQTNIAEELSSSQRAVSQGQASRWVTQVAEWVEAGNVLPDFQPPTTKPTAIDPAVIDMGERQDGLTKRQRKKRKADDADD